MAKPNLPLFARFKRRAVSIVQNPGQVLDELAKADTKAHKNRDVIEVFWEDLKLIIRMSRAWAKGEFKKIPTTTIVLLVAAIAYFVSPFDAIPDFIAGFGYLDDAAVIAFVVRSLKSDIDVFRKWERKKR